MILKNWVKKKLISEVQGLAWSLHCPGPLRPRSQVGVLMLRCPRCSGIEINSILRTKNENKLLGGLFICINCGHTFKACPYCFTYTGNGLLEFREKTNRELLIKCENWKCGKFYSLGHCWPVSREISFRYITNYLIWSCDLKLYINRGNSYVSGIWWAFHL